MIVVVVLSLPFLWVLSRRPVLRRLALRNAIRRPKESLLVIAGSLLGTAIMTGSFVVGDTFDASIRAGAYDQLGPVDEVVSVVGAQAPADLQERLGDFGHPDIDGTVPALRTGAAVATTTGPKRAEPSAQLLEVDFAAARDFGDDPAATGISGATPAEGRAVIVDDLARTLHVGAGDEVDVFAYGSSVRLRVDRVLPQRGVAGLWLEHGTASNNLLVAPGTIERLASGGAIGDLIAAPPTALLLVSNRGGVEDSAVHSEDVKAALEERVEGLLANVATAKADLLEIADEEGKSLTDLYTSLGMFAVLAGILLLVNIFFMLADERKSELGMLRAVGLKRSGLVGAFATEGWGYALVASTIGTFAGLGLGRVIMAFAGRIYSSGPEEFRLTLRWHFDWSSVWTGFAAGFAISVLTVAATSIWLSRFNIIHAIRDLSEPVARKPRRRAHVIGLAATVAGLALCAVGFPAGQFAAVMLGPVLVLTGLGPALARRISRDRAVSVIGVLVLVWGVVVIPVAVALDTGMDVMMFVLQGTTLVGASVVLVTQHQSAIGHALARLARRSLNVRLGLAYPLARKFRTALTLGMFALVVFVLVYVSVISAMFQNQLDEFTAASSGGFNTIVSSNPANPIPLDRLRAEQGVTAVAPLVTLPTEITPVGEDEPTFWTMTAYDEAFVEEGPPALDDPGEYASDDEAYGAVLEDPSLAIVDAFFLASGAGPPHGQLEIGDSFVVRDPVGGTERELTIAAIAENDWVFNGGFMSVRAAEEIFGDRAIANRAYVAVDDPEAFSERVATAYLANGGEAEAIGQTVETFLSLQQQFFLLMRGYLTLGLLVGIAGIGVIMVRAVRERRRQVGVLRALGFEAPDVRSAFVIESAFVAVEGIFCGVVLALVTAYSLTLTETFGESFGFVIPFRTVALLAAGTLLATYLATVTPARAAARIRPAVALRIAD